MLMVIFGAGASYDSFPNLPIQVQISPDHYMPLTKDLFHHRYGERLDATASLTGVVSELRSSTQPIEKQLDVLNTQSEKYPHFKRSLFALRYYLADLIRFSQKTWRLYHHGATNYATLLWQIEKWRIDHGERVCFVTFNYDTMLDDAFMALFGLSNLSLAAYVANPETMLFKVHGSVEWVRRVSGLELRDRSGTTSLADVLASLNSVELTDEYSGQKNDSCHPPGTGVIPAIAIPIEHGKSFEFPSSHQRCLQEVLPDITHLITIGWRGKEQHFFELWNGRIPQASNLRYGPPSLRKILVVSGTRPGALRTGQDIQKSLPTTRTILDVLGDGFSAFVRSDRLTKFLAE